MSFLVPVWTQILKCMIKRCIKKYRTIPQKNLFKNHNYVSTNCIPHVQIQISPRNSSRGWDAQERLGPTNPQGCRTLYQSPLGSLGGQNWGCLPQWAPLVAVWVTQSPAQVLHGHRDGGAASHHCQQCWSQSRTRVKHHQTTAKCPQCLEQSPLLGFPVTKLWISYWLKHLLIFINYL